MRKLNGFIGFCVLALLCSTASAQIKIVIDNQEIPTEDIESIVILPNSNLISITTNTAYTVQRSSAEPPAPGVVAINSFSASPSTITTGQSTTLSWTTANATSCTATGGGGGWNTRTIGLPNSNTAVTLSSAGTFSFILTCQGESGSVSKTRTVIVNDPASDPVTSCATPSLSGTTVAWEKFWKVEFPGPGYNNTNTAITRSGYIAFEFNTGDVVDNGYLATVGNTITSGTRKGAISECPGDFDVKSECTHIWGIGGGISWATNGTSGACALKPNTTYYLNVTFTDGSDSKSSSCTSSQCIATIQHFNR